MTETTMQNNTGIRGRPVQVAALLKEFWSYFSENRGAVIGLIFFVIIVLIADLCRYHSTPSSQPTVSRRPSAATLLADRRCP